MAGEMSGAGAKRIRFGPFEADAAAGELRSNGRLIRLQEQPFQVLLALLDRAGEVVTREELRQRLWPDDSFGDFDQGLNTASTRCVKLWATPRPARSSWKRYPSEATGLSMRCNRRGRPSSPAPLREERLGAGSPAGRRYYQPS
jgi:hypothetical protein